MNTLLEKQQFNNLYNIVRHKFSNPTSKDIEDMIEFMCHSLFYDDRVNDIYSKSSISREILKKIFIYDHVNTKTLDEYKKIVFDSDPLLLSTLEKYRIQKNKKKSCFFTCC